MSTLITPTPKAQEDLVKDFIDALHLCQKTGLMPYNEEDKREYRAMCIAELTTIANQLTDFSKIEIFNRMQIVEKDTPYISYWLIAVLGGEKVSARERKERYIDLDAAFRKLDGSPLTDALSLAERSLLRRITTEDNEGDKIVG